MKIKEFIYKILGYIIAIIIIFNIYPILEVEVKDKMTHQRIRDKILLITITLIIVLSILIFLKVLK